jgi:integrase
VKVNVRDTTRRDYEGNIRRHLQPHFGSRVIRTITPEAIERFRTDRHQRTGLRTVNKCLTLLSMMFGYALRHRWVSSNPASMVRKLRPASGPGHDLVEDNILVPAEIGKLLEAADDRSRLIIKTGILSGLREGELLGLKWTDIDWTSGTL